MITLYQLKGCPYALRTRIALTEKQLPFETRFIDRKNKPREVLEVSPGGGTPVIYDGAARLRDSSIIADYLEEKYPQVRLMPADPFGRAQLRMALDDLDDVIDAVSDLFRAQPKDGEQPDIGRIEEARGEVRQALVPWDAKLAKQPFAFGESFSSVDVNLYAHLVVFERLQKEPLPEDLPHLKAWFAKIAARPSVATAQKDAM